MLAILVAALAPALSHALASATGADWTEVCTAQGSKWVQAGEAESDPVPASGHPLEHCPYCSLHASDLGLPPAAPLAFLPAQRGQALPPAFLSAPRTLHAWVSAQPRAPPLAC